jgi:Icc-related predicted phosphoesterase
MVNVKNKKVNVGKVGMRLVTGYMFLPFINPRDYSKSYLKKKGKKLW